MLNSIDPTKPLSLNDLILWSPTRPPEIISNGILPKGHIMFLYGEQGTYKSWLLLDLVFSIIQGKNWLVYKTQPAKVLVLNPEMPVYDYRERIIDYIQTKQLSIASNLVNFWTDLDIKLNENSGKGLLISYVQKFQPDLIIIDGLEFVCRGDVATSIVAEGIKDTINQIRKINNASFLFVHHKRKGSYDVNSNQRFDRGIDDMYGHSLIKNLADTVLEVYKDDKDEDVIYMRSMKLRMSKTGSLPILPYRFNRDNLSFELFIGDEMF